MTREATNHLLDLVDAGVLDRDMVILACVGFMSEDDVASMCAMNDFFYLPEDEEEDFEDSEDDR